MIQTLLLHSPMKIPCRFLKYIIPALLVALPGGALYLIAWIYWRKTRPTVPLLVRSTDEDVSKRD